MAHPKKEIKFHAGGLQRVAVPGGLVASNMKSPDAQRRNTLGHAEPHALSAWWSPSDTRKGSVPAFLKEQEDFWQAGGTHKAGLHTHHGLAPDELAEVRAREHILWKKAGYDIMRRKARGTVDAPRSISTTRWPPGGTHVNTPKSDDYDSEPELGREGRSWRDRGPHRTLEFNDPYDYLDIRGPRDARATDPAEPTLSTSPAKHNLRRSIPRAVGERAPLVFTSVDDSSSDSDAPRQERGPSPRTASRRRDRPSNRFVTVDDSSSAPDASDDGHGEPVPKLPTLQGDGVHDGPMPGSVDKPPRVGAMVTPGGLDASVEAHLESTPEVPTHKGDGTNDTPQAGPVDSPPQATSTATFVPGGCDDYFMPEVPAKRSGDGAFMLPTVPSLPSDDDSVRSNSDSLGALLQNSNASPYFETDSWFDWLEKYTQPLLKEFRRANMKSRVKIAILDTGIDLRHDDFKGQSPHHCNGRIKKVEDFVEPGGTGADIYGHGTHCAASLRKVAPAADMYVARVAVAKGKRSGLKPENVVKALNRACGSGMGEDGVENWDVDIVSMSLGFYDNDPALSRAVQIASANGKIIVAAVSNDGDWGPNMWPASERVVFAIHPARGYGQTSGTAPLPIVGNDFSILGENVESAWFCGTDADGHAIDTSKRERKSGASVATPIAAGVMALVLELAMQGDEGNPVSHALFARMLPRLKSFNGMNAILEAMSTRRDPLNLNIVPWSLLDELYDSNPNPKNRASRTHIAVIMHSIFRQRFGKRWR